MTESDARKAIIVDGTWYIESDDDRAAVREMTRDERSSMFSMVRERSEAVRGSTAVIGETNLRAIVLLDVANAMGLSLTEGESLCVSAGCWQ